MIERARKEITEKLRGHKYCDDLKSALRRYNEALDDIDWSNSYLKLWSLLEFLTATSSPTSRHEDTIKRAAFVWKDSKAALSELEFLRVTRNRHVHHSVAPNNGEMAIYLLKSYVEALFRFHFRNDYDFSSVGSAGSFLSLPTDRQILEQKKRDYGRALKFQDS